MLVARVPSILTRGLDNALHKRPPVSRALSSQDVLSDMASASHVKQKNSTNVAMSDGIHHYSVRYLTFCFLVLDNYGDL